MVNATEVLAGEAIESTTSDEKLCAMVTLTFTSVIVAPAGTPLTGKLMVRGVPLTNVLVAVLVPVAVPVTVPVQVAVELNELAVAPAQRVMSFTKLSGGVTVMVAVPVTVQPFTSFPVTL